MLKWKPKCKLCAGTGTYVTDGGGRANCESCNGYEQEYREVDIKKDFNDAWKAGYKCAYDEAHEIIMKAAIAYFEEGDDDRAQLLRSYAKEISHKAKEHLRD